MFLFMRGFYSDAPKVTRYFLMQQIKISFCPPAMLNLIHRLTISSVVIIEKVYILYAGFLCAISIGNERSYPLSMKETFDCAWNLLLFLILSFLLSLKRNVPRIH